MLIIRPILIFLTSAKNAPMLTYAEIALWLSLDFFSACYWDVLRSKYELNTEFPLPILFPKYFRIRSRIPVYRRALTMEMAAPIPQNLAVPVAQGDLEVFVVFKLKLWCYYVFQF